MEILLLIIFAAQIIFFLNLNKKIMTAQETLEALVPVVTDLQTVQLEQLELIKTLISGSGDLTADEVTAIATPILEKSQEVSAKIAEVLTQING